MGQPLESRGVGGEPSDLGLISLSQKALGLPGPAPGRARGDQKGLHPITILLASLLVIPANPSHCFLLGLLGVCGADMGVGYHEVGMIPWELRAPPAKGELPPLTSCP